MNVPVVGEFSMGFSCGFLSLGGWECVYSVEFRINLVGCVAVSVSFSTDSRWEFRVLEGAGGMRKLEQVCFAAEFLLF